MNTDSEEGDDGNRDIKFIRRAMELAKCAVQQGEVPVGALIVDESGTILSEAWNRSIASHDATAHAEILAIRRAGERLGNYRLPATTLYVTLEPCPMCVGAMIHARIQRLVFAAHDPKSGAAGGRLDWLNDPAHNHQLQVTGGVMAEAASEQLRAFFRERRKVKGMGRGM